MPGMIITLRDFCQHVSLLDYISDCDEYEGMSFGSRLKLARERAKLTQPQLAQKMGWAETQSRISQYENDKREPMLRDIERFAEILNISAAALAFGDPVSKRQSARQPKKGAAKYPKGQRLTKLTAT